jgi:prepilin-type N-terminal cleavage/methylation domain-containing protein
MKVLYRLMKSRKHGFVLAELIIAVAILGTISSAVIMTLYGANTAAKSNQSEPQQETAPVGTTEVLTDSTVPDIVLTNIEEPADTQTIQDEANEAGAEIELKIIQTAMDTMMVHKGMQTVTETAATDDMTAFPAEAPLYPKYLRGQHSTFKYSCDGTGQVVQVK